LKISVCGKGGSGKSTVVSLLAYAAHTRGLTTLVVDSDESNSGLFRMLGFKESPVSLMELVGGKERLKEKMKQPAVLSDAEIYLNDIPFPYVLEGCACPMGVLSKEFLNKLRLKKHEIALVDMEAGVEHFGRGIETGIDAAIVVVEPSFESITLAEKINELVKQFKIQLWAVLNKITSEDLADRLKDELNNIGLESIDFIPNDPAIFKASLNGSPLHPGISSGHINRIIDFICLHHKPKETVCV
jgi:CO dehydrogenase maturation factor